MVAPTLSIVAPAYNEERNIPAFIAAIVPVLESLGETFEIIFINDGSRDNTLGLLAAAASQDPRIKVIGLARNFGKDIALSAGLAHASGKAVIPIDCDLQHPVELIPQFVAKWREGYDMVLGVRSKRDEEGFVRRKLSQTYYKVMRFMTSVEIPPNAGDFRLLDRKILDVINKMPERHRFMKGIFAWPGFKVASIEFQANVRANDTRTSWSFFKLWSFALDGLFSFSTAPLKLWTYIGVASAAGGFIYLMITLIQKLFFGIAVPGYASLLIIVLFFNGLLLISNGIQGEYIARIFEEVKGRPLYVIGQTFGFDTATLAQTVGAATAIPTVIPDSTRATAPAMVPPPPSPAPAPALAASPPAPPPRANTPSVAPPPRPLARAQTPSVAPPAPRTNAPSVAPPAAAVAPAASPFAAPPAAPAASPEAQASAADTTPTAASPAAPAPKRQPPPPRPAG